MNAPALDLTPEALAPRLAGFLARERGEPVEVLDLQRFPVGMSWITIGFRARVGRGAAVREEALILRLGPPGGLLAPYRAEPEFRVLRALEAVPALPIPRARAFSDDASVLGAPFLVTTRADGTAPMPWRGATTAPDAEREAERSAGLGRDFAEAIGRIHAFDWRATPLAALWPQATPENVARAQVERWARHAGLVEGDAGPHGGPRPSPQLRYAWRWLEASAPVADRVSIVHGDYRVGNFLERDGRITAVLDWELMHAGDPHEDVAWAGLRAFSPSDDRIGGMIHRDAFLERYRDAAGRTLRPEVLRWYEVLGQFKMAAMLIGAIRRSESSRSPDVRMVAMGFQLAPTLLELNRLIEVAS